jgi:TIR domain
LRPVSWQITPLGTFPPLPSNSYPVTQWNNSEAALLDCADGIRHILSHPVAPPLVHGMDPDKQPSDKKSEAVQYSTCFISYSSKDQAFAARLYTDLQYRGVRCWFAPEDLKVGDQFRQRIDESIRAYDKLLLILSTHSVASPWVEKEVETAFEKEHRTNRLVLFPVKLDESVMHTDRAWAADIRRTRHIGDFTHWKEYDAYQVMLERLLHDLKTGTT